MYQMLHHKITYSADFQLGHKKKPFVFTVSPCYFVPSGGDHQSYRGTFTIAGDKDRLVVAFSLDEPRGDETCKLQLETGFLGSRVASTAPKTLAETKQPVLSIPNPGSGTYRVECVVAFSTLKHSLVGVTMV